MSQIETVQQSAARNAKSSAQKWADQQIASLSDAEFGNIYDQWFFDEINWQDLYDFPLTKERNIALGKAANARNQAS